MCEETEFRPKPMVPVDGRPILCLGYKGEFIKDHFRNYHWNTGDVTLKLGCNPQIRYQNTHDEEDWTVTLLDTGAEMQTGGPLRRP